MVINKQLHVKRMLKTGMHYGNKQAITCQKDAEDWNALW